MAQTPEAKVKSFLRGRMKEWYPNAWHYPLPGGPYGKIGAPDDMWVIGDKIASVTVFVESKADGNAPTEMQWRNLLQLRDQGAIVAVLIGRDVDKLLVIKKTIDQRLAHIRGLENGSKVTI